MNHLAFSPGTEVRLFDCLAGCAAATVDYLRNGAIALSGGATFARLYPLWVSLGPECSRARFFPVDERMAPFDSPESNWGVASREFLGKIGRGADARHHPSSPDGFERILKKSFSSRPPIFDVVFLGMGADGHTAGLFPGSESLADRTSVVLQTVSPRPPTARLTLGPATIIAARLVIAIVSGAGKKPAVDRLLKGDRGIPLVEIVVSRARSIVFIERGLVDAR